MEEESKKSMKMYEACDENEGKKRKRKEETFTIYATE